MNFMEAKLVCKKHPYNNPQQGVCSSCLAEKLSNLTTPCNYPSLSNSHAKSTQVGASSYSPSNPSGDVSPPVTSHTRRRGSDSAGHVTSGNGGLKKSRSMIVYASRKSRLDAGMAAGGRSGKMMMKKKGGFWAKLIRSTSKRTKDVFTHSRSTTCQQRFDSS